MKKLIVITMAIVAGLMFMSTAALAQDSGSEVFTITAKVPVAGEAKFAVNKVTEGAGEDGKDLWKEVLDNNLNFGTLEITDDGIFLPESYYVIDVGSDGIGNADLSFAYEDTGSPDDAIADLGERGTLTTLTMVYTDPENPLNEEGMSLQEANSHTLDGDALAGGQWYRLIVGISTGEGSGEPFTGSDADGDYSGQLTINWVFD